MLVIIMWRARATPPGALKVGCMNRGDWLLVAVLDAIAIVVVVVLLYGARLILP